MKKLKEIGYESEILKNEPGGITLKESIGKGDPKLKSLILNYLRSGKAYAIMCGIVRDVLSEDNEVIGPPQACTDGTWGWYDCHAYYVEKYNISLPDEFIIHMKANNWTVPNVDLADLGLE